MFLLQAENIKDLTHYLQQQQWLQANETVMSATKPGEGNMNYVLRINTGHRTFIIKQSRPYVEKYPQIAAPANRAIIEGEFYKATQLDTTISNYSPKLIGIDAVNNVIAEEDLGLATDYTYLYNLQEKVTVKEVEAFTRYISHLHHHFHKPIIDDDLSNMEMKKLNHQHIFIYPFLEDNDFNLDQVQQGLQAIATPFKQDVVLKEKATALGNKYLEKGHYLLHGDFYPGSWLKTNNGIKIIDPEFCFYGSAEFDVAVMIAHLKMTNHSQEIIEYIINHYAPSTGFSMPLLHQFIGIEILRRLLGLAQLPLQLSLHQKQVLLEEAHQLVIDF